MKRTVLIIEDNPHNLELAEYLLEESGFEVRVAMDAEATRREMLNPAPEIILMDMHLPGSDGLELTQEFRARAEFAKVPIIALTAHAMRGDKERFLAGGCDGYIAKPISAGTFAAEVAQAIAQGRLPEP